MRFLVDPSSVTPGTGSWLFLCVLCIVLPVAVVRQHRAFRGQTLSISRIRIYASGLASHALLLFLVWLVVWEQQLEILAPYRPAAWHLGLGLVSLALGILPFARDDRRDPHARARTKLIAPRSRTEFGLFYLLSVSAGFAEQMAYRGILFTLLAWLSGSWWLAAVGSAAMFGIAHLFQGWKSAGVAAAIGLRDQVVVGLTGTLWVAIVVHILHDAIAGTVLGRRGRDASPMAAQPDQEPREVPHAVS